MKLSEIDRPRDFTAEMKKTVDEMSKNDPRYLEYKDEPRLQEMILESMYAGIWLVEQMKKNNDIPAMFHLALPRMAGMLCGMMSTIRRNPWPIVIAIAHELRLAPLE